MIFLDIVYERDFQVWIFFWNFYSPPRRVYERGHERPCLQKLPIWALKVSLKGSKLYTRQYLEFLDHSESSPEVFLPIWSLGFLKKGVIHTWSCFNYMILIKNGRIYLLELSDCCFDTWFYMLILSARWMRVGFFFFRTDWNLFWFLSPFFPSFFEFLLHDPISHFGQKCRESKRQFHQPKKE